MSDFNPADHTVDEVKKYVSENPDQVSAVLEAERARGDDSRSTLVKHLEGVVDGQQEAPVAAEPAAVTVEPNAAPSAQSYSFFGKDYERTADGGFRVKG